MRFLQLEILLGRICLPKIRALLCCERHRRPVEFPPNVRGIGLAWSMVFLTEVVTLEAYKNLEVSLIL